MDRPEERIALIELVDRDGRGRRVHDVHQWPVTLGRALDNTIVLDDPHVAAHHATLALAEDGSLQLQVGHSTNGLTMGRRNLKSGEHLSVPPDGLQCVLGGQRLSLRLPSQTLEAERPLQAARLGGRSLLAATGVLVGVEMAERWLQLDPGANFTQWLPWLLGLPVGMAVWCGLWALGSKVFRHGFDFWPHLAIAIPGMLLLELSRVLIPNLAASLGWPDLWRLQAMVIPALLLAWVVRGHLLQVLPQRGRTIGWSLALLLVGGLSVNLAVNQHNTGLWINEAYMRILPLPALRWDRAQPVTSLTAAMLPMKQALAERVAQAAKDDPDGNEAEAAAED
jgi:hypothetical protein